jgi:glycosyltransferase involved in cell wall biosynthesis
MSKTQSKPLSIVFVTNNYIPYAGGVVNSIETARAALQALGHKVTIVTLDFTGALHESESGVIRLLCPIRFVHKKNIMAVPWRPTHEIEKVIAQIKPDILHTHHPFLLGQSAAKVARRHGIPSVFTYHTLYEDYAHYVPLPQTLTRFVTMQLVNRYCQKMNAIIAPSESVKRIIENQQIKTPVSVIPSSIDVQFLSPAIREFKNFSHGPFRLLCVTRFVKEKNVSLLLDVFAQLIVQPCAPPYTLTLIGYGYEFEALQTYAYEHHQFSPAQVQFIHKPKKEVIIEWYRTADLFLFSSASDTQGLVLAEAMGAGMPIVAVDGPGQQSVINQGKNGFIVQSRDEMVATIALIASDNTLRQRLSVGAWQTAQRYTPERMAHALVDLYCGLISQVHCSKSFRASCLPAEAGAEGGACRRID